MVLLFWLIFIVTSFLIMKLSHRSVTAFFSVLHTISGAAAALGVVRFFVALVGARMVGGAELATTVTALVMAVVFFGVTRTHDGYDLDREGVAVKILGGLFVLWAAARLLVVS